MKVLWIFRIFFGLTLTTTATFGVKVSCKQAKRPDGSSFFDCGHNVPKEDLKVRNNIIIWRTVTPEPPEHAYLPPHAENFKPSINLRLVKVDEPNYPNVSYNILTPFLIKPISPVTPFSETIQLHSDKKDIDPQHDDPKYLELHDSDKSGKPKPLKRSKIINPEKQTEINHPELGADINQPDSLKSSHAMQRIETANLISLSSEIDQQTSGQQFTWIGCATSIWIFYSYFFLFILM